MVETLKVEMVTRENFDRWYPEARDLAREHSERRVRKTSLAWIAGLTPDTIAPGSLFVAHDGENALGVSVATGPGGPNFTVVRPEVRRKGIALALIAEKVKTRPGYETLVAIDNEPSIALMLKAGLVADALVDNGNGKRVLRFSPRDVRELLPTGLPTEAPTEAQVRDEQAREEFTKEGLIELLTAKEGLIGAQDEKIRALDRYVAALKGANAPWLVRLAYWLTGFRG